MRNGLLKVIFFYLLFHFSSFSFAQITSEKDRQFFQYLYNFQFSEADSLLSTLDSVQRPSDYNFLRSHFMRWYHLPIHEQTEAVLTRYIRYLEEIEEEYIDTTTNYLIINSSLLKAEFNYNQGNYYKAFQNAANVYDVVKDKLEQEPEQIEIKFLASLYHYYYQYYKSENPAFGAMMWLFKEGDKEEGLKWLEEVSQANSIIQTEALVYLTHIYLRLENNPLKASHFAQQLLNLHPDNLKFYELMIESSLAREEQSEFIFDLTQELQEAEKIYFQKYGVCYEAIFAARSEKLNKREKLLKLQDALLFLCNNGGGKHLSSLVYFSMFKLTGNAEYLEQKIKLEPYQYELTGYPSKYSKEDYKN